MPSKYSVEVSSDPLVVDSKQVAQLNLEFKETTMRQAINYLATTTGALEPKLKYLHNLQTHNFRNDSTGKYECNLNKEEIRYVLQKGGDEKLMRAFFETEDEKLSRRSLIVLIVFLILFVGCLFYCNYGG